MAKLKNDLDSFNFTHYMNEATRHHGNIIDLTVLHIYNVSILKWPVSDHHCNLILTKTKREFLVQISFLDAKAEAKFLLWEK